MKTWQEYVGFIGGRTSVVINRQNYEDIQQDAQKELMEQHERMRKAIHAAIQFMAHNPKNGMQPVVEQLSKALSTTNPAE